MAVTQHTHKHLSLTQKFKVI